MDSQAIQTFLMKHRSKDRTYIPKDHLEELNEVFLKQGRIYLNISDANPLSIMETVIVALSTSFRIPEMAIITMNSPNTIKTTLTRVRMKLKVRTQYAIVSEAIRQGYIKLIH